MALRQPDAVAIGSGEAQTFLVISSHCQLRPAPNHDFVAIGLLRSGTVIRGFPHVSAGQPWIKLHDEEAAIYVADRHNREDGVWVPHTSPKYGKLLQSQDQDVRYGQGASNQIREGGKAFHQVVILRGKGSYEETILLDWKASALKDQQLARKDSVIEICIDSASGRPPLNEKDPSSAGDGKEVLKPAEGVIIKRIECGKETSTSLSNMPDGRYFLASVIVTFEGNRKIRSPWIRVATLHKAGRDQRLAPKDALGNLRGKCTQKGCPCDGWVAPALKFTLNSAPQVFCRRCACRADDHVLVRKAAGAEEESVESPQQGTNLNTEDSQAMAIALPPEARSWNERQCNLWRWSNGALHPTENPHAARRRIPRKSPRGATGKVTVVVPTTEERQYFHDQVWKCFLNQTWPNKELIVIETYRGGSSPVFNKVAAEDNRLKYLKFRCGHATDLSIGSKRNIAMHCADGDYIASFDDDDIYAPTYLETMITELVNQKAHFITLSTWYFFEVKTGLFGFCDPYAWAKANNYTERQMYGWLWGYGFSYIHHLQPALDRGILYPDQNMAEDITFVKAWKSMLGEKSACLLFDKAGIVLHTIHGRNTSNSFALKEVPREEVLDTDFADLYDVLKHYLENFPRKNGTSNFILNQVSAKQRTKRRYRKLTIHHNDGEFTIKCVRGVTGFELKRICAGELRTAPDLLRVYRQKPEAAEANDLEASVETGSDEDAQDKRKEAVDPMHVLLGSWVYGAKQTEYHISRTASGDLQFEGPHARCGTVTGKLEFVWGWLSGDLRSPEGEHVGNIRFRWVQEVDSMLSNFRPLNKDWGKDIIAKRVGEYTPAIDEDTPMSEQKDENAPLRDDERLELRATELWLAVLQKAAVEDLAARKPTSMKEPSQDSRGEEEAAPELPTVNKAAVRDWLNSMGDGIDLLSLVPKLAEVAYRIIDNQAEEPALYRFLDVLIAFRDGHKTAEDIPPMLPQIMEVLEDVPVKRLVSLFALAQNEAKQIVAEFRKEKHANAEAAQDSASVEEAIQKSMSVEEEAPKTLSVEEESTSVEEAYQKHPSVEEASQESTSVEGESHKSVLTKEAPQKTTSAEEGTGLNSENDDSNGHLELTIYIDSDLGIKEMVRVSASSTIWNVKEQLASLDVTGETTPESFDLKWLGPDNVPLPDAESVLGGSNMLELCV